MASAQVRYGFTQGESLARLSRFVGRRTGLFKEPFPSFLPSHLPDIFVFNADPLGSGAALSETEALICTMASRLNGTAVKTMNPKTRSSAPSGISASKPHIHPASPCSPKLSIGQKGSHTSPSQKTPQSDGRRGIR